jgi:hypothetical protein
MQIRLSSFVVASVLSGISTIASAFPRLGEFSASQSLSFDGFSSATYDFRGIVGLGNCSGSLVRFDDSRKQDLAMVLSNGHCVGLLKPGVVIKNSATRKAFTILAQDASSLGTVQGTKILYATMTNTDLALFLLQNTFAEIEDQYGIEPLTLARTAPELETPVEVISGYWKRGYSCSIEANIPVLKEAEWTFTNSLRYSRPGCEVIGGTSGSPVIETGTRTVIAVNNTVNESGKACKMNNPCEVGSDGSTFAQKGYAYAQQTYWLYSCRNAKGDVDLSVPGCVLPK